MSPSNHKFENFVGVFAENIKFLIKFLVCGTVGFVAIATAYVIAKVVLVAVRVIFTALGI